MSSDSQLIATRYARALFQLAEEENAHPDVKADLSVLHNILEQSAELRKFLVNPIVTRQNAEKAISSVLDATRASTLTRKFLFLLSRQRRLNILFAAIQGYLSMLAESRGELTVQVTSAKALGDEQLKLLNQAIAKATGKQVTLQQETKEELLGGVRVRIGSKMLDYSVAGKLERLRSVLLSRSA